MKLIQSIIILITGLFSNDLLSQNNIVTGFVVDINNIAIEYANISMINVDSNKNEAGTITDENGKFTIPVRLKSNYKLVISYLGYKNWTKLIRFNHSKDLGRIMLEESVLHNREVVVTAKRKMISKNEDKLVFNVQGSPLKTDANGMEVLEQTPLVWVENNNILIRNENATVLVDGRKLNLSGEDLSNYIRNIKSEDIKYVELQTGKSSNMDAESSAALINIILLRKPAGFNSSANIAYKSGKNLYSIYSGLNASYGSTNWNIYGKYNLNRYNGSRKMTTEIEYTKSGDFLETLSTEKYDQKRQSYQLGFVSQFHQNHELGLELFNMSFSESSPVFADLSISNNRALVENGKVRINNEPDHDFLTGIFNYSWNIADDETIKFFADYLKQSHKGLSNSSSIYKNGQYKNSYERYASESSTEVIAFQSDYMKSISSDLKLRTGLKYTLTNKRNRQFAEYLENSSYILNERSTNFLKYNEGISAVYFSLGKYFFDKNYIKAGLRLEKTDLERNDLIKLSMTKQNYSNVFPSLHYSRNLTATETLSASYSRGIRRPSFKLLNNDVSKINDFNYVIGNPDLEPEYINRYELSYQSGRSIFSMYYNETINTINNIYFLEKNIAYLKNINIGSQIESGLEYHDSQKIFDWWRLNYYGNVYYRNFDVENQQSSFEKLSFRLNLSSNFKLSHTTSIDLLGRYTSPENYLFNEEEEYYTMIFVLKKSFLDKKLNLKISIDDVFNSLEFKNKRKFENYITSTLDKPTTRKIYIGITYNFSDNNEGAKKKNKTKNDARGRL